MRRQSIRSQRRATRREIGQLGHHSSFRRHFLFWRASDACSFQESFPFHNKSALLDDPMAIQAPAHPRKQRAIRRRAGLRVHRQRVERVCAAVSVFGPLVMEKSVAFGATAPLTQARSRRETSEAAA